MKRVINILGGIILVMLVLVIHGLNQPDYLNLKTTWYGGLPGDHRKLEGMTLHQITAEANELAAIYGEPVQFKAEEGGMVYHAYAEGDNKSKCLIIHEKAWWERKLIMNRVNKLCEVFNHHSVGLSSYPDIAPSSAYSFAFPG